MLALFSVVSLSAVLGTSASAKGGRPLSSLEPYPKAKWTVAVYMNGDNNLETSITGGKTKAKRFSKTSEVEEYIHPGDFHTELAALGSNEDVHVVALVDRSPLYSTSMGNWTNTRLYYIEEGDYPDDVRSTYYVNVTGSDELNMGDSQSLSWFIRTVQTNFPSDHFYFSMWDHNWGWHNGWFQEDDTSDGDTMNYADITKTLNVQTPDLIDVIGYDACVSAQIEVLHTWRPFASVFAGSQDYVGWGGVDYSSVISTLRSNPDITPQNLSVAIAQTILTDPDDGCASSFKLDENFDKLVESVDALSLLFLQYLDTIRDTLVSIRSKVPMTPKWPSDDFHRDLYSMALETTTQLSAYPDIVKAASDILSYFDASLIYNSAVTGSLCEGGRGLTIYWTKSGERTEVAYGTTSFGKATHWGQFLKEF